MLAMDELDELKGRVGGGAMIGSNRVLLTSNDVDLLLFVKRSNRFS